MRGREDDDLSIEEVEDVEGGGLDVSALDPLEEIELDVSDIVADLWSVPWRASIEDLEDALDDESDEVSTIERELKKPSSMFGTTMSPTLIASMTSQGSCLLLNVRTL